jgi:hypothetical protein
MLRGAAAIERVSMGETSRFEWDTCVSEDIPQQAVRELQYELRMYEIMIPTMHVTSQEKGSE